MTNEYDLLFRFMYLKAKSSRGERTKGAKLVVKNYHDLGFQLRYLKKLGKIGKVRIVGLPIKV